jgi:Flp pilus assembly CpaE family ATPase
MLVPNSYESVAESINMGVPIAEHAKNSRVTKALVEMNSRLIGGTQTAAQPNVVRRVFASLIGG